MQARNSSKAHKNKQTSCNNKKAAECASEYLFAFLRLWWCFLLRERKRVGTRITNYIKCVCVYICKYVCVYMFSNACVCVRVFVLSPCWCCHNGSVVLLTFFYYFVLSIHTYVNVCIYICVRLTIWSKNWLFMSFVAHLACCGPTLPMSCAELAVICVSAMVPDSMPSGCLQVPVSMQW